jgi:hypothetical protein
MTQSSSHYCDYTVAALEDELVRVLCSKNSADIVELEDGGIQIYLHRMYIDQAEGLIYRINACERPPEFVIWEKDIPEGLAMALEELGKVGMKRVITGAVRRLYESVDPEYFHTNGLYCKTPWRIGRQE